MSYAYRRTALLDGCNSISNDRESVALGIYRRVVLMVNAMVTERYGDPFFGPALRACTMKPVAEIATNCMDCVPGINICFGCSNE